MKKNIDDSEYRYVLWAQCKYCSKDERHCKNCGDGDMKYFRAFRSLDKAKMFVDMWELGKRKDYPKYKIEVMSVDELLDWLEHHIEGVYSLN